MNTQAEPLLNNGSLQGSFLASSVSEAAGSLLLASNSFYRDFTDDPTLTDAAKGLPQMQGLGLVRDFFDHTGVLTVGKIKTQFMADEFIWAGASHA